MHGELRYGDPYRRYSEREPPTGWMAVNAPRNRMQGCSFLDLRPFQDAKVLLDKRIPPELRKLMKKAIKGKETIYNSSGFEALPQPWSRQESILCGSSTELVPDFRVCLSVAYGSEVETAGRQRQHILLRAFNHIRALAPLEDIFEGFGEVADALSKMKKNGERPRYEGIFRTADLDARGIVQGGPHLVQLTIMIGDDAVEVKEETLLANFRFHDCKILSLPTPHGNDTIHIIEVFEPGRYRFVLADIDHLRNEGLVR